MGEHHTIKGLTIPCCRLDVLIGRPVVGCLEHELPAGVVGRVQLDHHRIKEWTADQVRGAGWRRWIKTHRIEDIEAGKRPRGVVAALTDPAWGRIKCGGKVSTGKLLSPPCFAGYVIEQVGIPQIVLVRNRPQVIIKESLEFVDKALIAAHERDQPRNVVWHAPYILRGCPFYKAFIAR